MEAREQFEQERAFYWAIRAELLKHYKGKWVAIVGGKVVAVAENKSEVLLEAFRKTGSKVMFVAQVGFEDRVLVVRRFTSGFFRPFILTAYPESQSTALEVR